MAHEYIRFVPELGLYGFSRSRATCKWRTHWCRHNCYFNKFYRMGRSKHEWDLVDDEWWQKIVPERFVQELLAVCGEPPKRFRFAIKGEIWNTIEDVTKVGRILQALDKTLFWIPTRAWHSSNIAEHIERYIFTMPNARVMASADTDTTPQELGTLERHDWSILFAGENCPEQMELIPGGVRDGVASHLDMVKCEKTWDMCTGHCAVCDNGCFNEDQVKVHLKKHR